MSGALRSAIALVLGGAFVACYSGTETKLITVEADAARDVISSVDAQASFDGALDSAGDAGGDTNSDAPPSLCAPGSVEACYGAASNTNNVGRCHAGVRRCALDGASWSDCAGAVLPLAAEDCATPEDDDCNGKANEVCTCTPGATRACYTGAPSTIGIASCHAGTQTCVADASGYGPCVGEALPALEQCGNGVDEDCDGLVDEEGSGCNCVPKSTTPCYNGPVGTKDKGICRAGLATCKDDGTGFGPCQGEITPLPETCGNASDEDCNGLTNESGVGCVCSPFSTRACYTGPAATRGVGSCSDGTETCAATGAKYDACANERLPSWENCDDDADEDCSGAAAPACHGVTWAATDTETLAGYTRVLANGDVMWARRKYNIIDLRRLAASNGAATVLTTIPITAEEARFDKLGNFYVIGNCSGTTVVGAVKVECGTGGTFILKIDVTGTPQWARAWPTVGFFTAATGAGGDSVLLVATNATQVDFGDGAKHANDRVMLRIDSSGVTKWVRTAPFGQYSIAVGPTGRSIFGFSESYDAQHAIVIAADGTDEHDHVFAQANGILAAFDAVSGYWIYRPNVLSRVDAAHAITKTTSGVPSFSRIAALSGGGLAALSGAFFERFDASGNPVAARDLSYTALVDDIDGDVSSLYLAGHMYFGYTTAFRGMTLGPNVGSFLVKLAR